MPERPLLVDINQLQIPAADIAFVNVGGDMIAVFSRCAEKDGILGGGYIEQFIGECNGIQKPVIS